MLLDPDDQLPQAAIEEGCDYTQALFENVDDPGQRWLPSWAWQRAKQVQHLVFERLITSGNEQHYATAQRFLIEQPAGDERELMQRMNEVGAQRVAYYEGLSPLRVVMFFSVGSAVGALAVRGQEHAESVVGEVGYPWPSRRVTSMIPLTDSIPLWVIDSFYQHAATTDAPEAPPGRHHRGLVASHRSGHPHRVLTGGPQP